MNQLELSHTRLLIYSSTVISYKRYAVLIKLIRQNYFRLKKNQKRYLHHKTKTRKINIQIPNSKVEPCFHRRKKLAQSRKLMHLKIYQGKINPNFWKKIVRILFKSLKILSENLIREFQKRLWKTNYRFSPRMGFLKKLREILVRILTKLAL